MGTAASDIDLCTPILAQTCNPASAQVHPVHARVLLTAVHALALAHSKDSAPLHRAHARAHDASKMPHLASHLEKYAQDVLLLAPAGL